MARVFFLVVVIFATLTLPCFAGQGTIRETDSQIIVEYWGGEDEVKAGQAFKAEREEQMQIDERNRQQEEAKMKLHEEKMERAERTVAARGYK